MFLAWNACYSQVNSSDGNSALLMMLYTRNVCRLVLLRLDLSSSLGTRYANREKMLPFYGTIFYAHRCFTYFNKNTVKTIILWDIITVYLTDCLHTKSSLFTQFLKADTNTRTIHQICKTIHYFSAFDSVFNFIKHFLQNTTLNCNTHESNSQYLHFFFKHNHLKYKIYK